MDRRDPAGGMCRKRRYDAALAVLGAVVAGGIAYTALHPTAWAIAYLPLLAAVAAALAWCALARTVLCRDEQRLLARSFTRPLKLALAVPGWAVFTLAFLCLPGNYPAEAEALAVSLATLWAVAGIVAVPIASLGLGLASVVLGARHMKRTPESEGPLYREGPFALALILFVGECALWGFGLFWFL